MYTYEPSLSQHVQRAYVTLADVLTRKSTASLSRLEATGERLPSLHRQFLEKNYLSINTMARGRYVNTYSHFAPSMSQNQKKFFPQNFEDRGFCPTQNFQFLPEGFCRFLDFRIHFDFRHGAFAHFYVQGHLPILGAKNGVCILHPKFFNFEFGDFCPFFGPNL